MRIPTQVETPRWFYLFLVLPVLVMVVLNLFDLGLAPNVRLGLTALVVTAAAIPLVFVAIPRLRDLTFKAYGAAFPGRIVVGRVTSRRRTASRRGFEEWEVTANVPGGKQATARVAVPGGTGEVLFQPGHKVLVKVGRDRVAIAPQPALRDNRALRTNAQLRR